MLFAVELDCCFSLEGIDVRREILCIHPATEIHRLVVNTANVLPSVRLDRMMDIDDTVCEQD